MFNYEVSNKEEKLPIGEIYYYTQRIRIKYYSEKELLNNYKNEIYNCGLNSATYEIYSKNRHGLNYELKKAICEEFDCDYTKENYEYNYKNNI